MEQSRTDRERRHGKSDIRRRLFLGSGSRLPASRGVASDRRGLHRRHAQNPTYEEVCADTTGHAETVGRVRPGRSPTTNCWRLLEIHDPTQANRQGPDVGTQYRSAIFYHTPEQQAAARPRRSGSSRAASSRGRSPPRSSPPRILPGRGVSPAISGEARRGKLPHPLSPSLPDSL